MDNQNNHEHIFLAKINNVINLLDEIDNIIDNNPEMQSNIDSELSDYDHIIQNYGTTMRIASKLKVLEMIELCRLKRVQFNSISRIGEFYNRNRQKLFYSHTRESFKNELTSLVSSLHQPYRYRVLTDGDVEDFIKQDDEEEKPKQKRHRKCMIDKETLQELLNKGMKNVDIAKKYGINPVYISQLKKKYGIKKSTGDE